MKIYNILKLDFSQMNLLFSNPRYKGIIQRKLRFLAEASEIQSIEIPNYFLVDRESDKYLCKDFLVSFIDSLKGEYFELRNHKKYIRLNKDELFSQLLLMEKNDIFLIRDFIDNSSCGYAWITKKDHVYIETHKGGLSSFWEFENIPTHYIVDKDMNILRKQEYSVKNYYIYCYEKNKWVREESSKEEIVSLELRYIDVVKEVADFLNKRLFNMKLIWLFANDKIILFDVFLPIGIGVIE